MGFQETPASIGNGDNGMSIEEGWGDGLCNLLDRDKGVSQQVVCSRVGNEKWGPVLEKRKAKPKSAARFPAP